MLVANASALRMWKNTEVGGKREPWMKADTALRCHLKVPRAKEVAALPGQEDSIAVYFEGQ